MILGYILKFSLKELRPKSIIEILPYAEKMIVKTVQLSSFPGEMKALSMKKAVHPRSKLAPLSPFIDKSGVLRVGGRLGRASCSYDLQHPMILPKRHRLTYLIISDSHLKNLHPGPSLQMSLLKQRFWIISGRDVVRKYIKQCQTCFRQKPELSKQLMADVPENRVTPSRPFLSVGVDYAGPVWIKTTRGRGRITTTKSYICIFVCLCTKALHLELVSDMSSNLYIAALRRFISRRGIPAEILSDNGTNFKGAKSELEELYNLLCSVEFRNHTLHFLSQCHIKFTFNPASAPHFGGLWEANVKSVKHHLKRATVDVDLTFEEMTTLLCEIECLLNSRPLCSMTSDPEDLDVLTPGHFLVGDVLTAIPEPPLWKIPTNRLTLWQDIQRRMQQFWSKWSIDVLHTFQKRAKWRTDEQNLNLGDLVLIKDDNLPPTEWLRGRIIQLHPGEDQRVRVVTLKTASGSLKRPIVKLAKLPNNDVSQFYDVEESSATVNSEC